MMHPTPGKYPTIICYPYYFSFNKMSSPLMFPLSITNRAIILEAKGIMLGDLLNALTLYLQ